MNLRQLVESAQGKTPDHEFAEKIGVPITYLNELKKGLVINDPTPQVLKRISEFNEEVSYINLLIAAGYLNEKDIGGLVEKYPSYVFGKSDYGVVSLENGFYINGVEIKNLIDVFIKSDFSNVSEVTVKFYAKIKGLDFKTIL